MPENIRTRRKTGARRLKKGKVVEKGHFFGRKKKRGGGEGEEERSF